LVSFQAKPLIELKWISDLGKLQQSGQRAIQAALSPQILFIAGDAPAL